MNGECIILHNLPVFGICGYSNTGKTTLIEQLIPCLSAQGLRVAAVKHDAHGIDVDHPGKDSDRLFRSGADVFLQGENEEFFRFHPGIHGEFSVTLKTICRQYDIVLVEGRKNSPMTKIWLQSASKDDTPEADGIVATLPPDIDRVGKVMSLLDNWLPGQWMKTPVYGCVLIGGESTRMGRAKHLLVGNGKTWLEKTVGLLKQVTRRVIIAGEGDVPPALSGIVRLPDVPGIGGPMAGILSAMRWAPYVSWLVTACDLPNLSLEALQWLLSTRRPGIWAIVPELKGSRGLDPLLAHYDFRSHLLLEEIAAGGKFRPGLIAESSKVKRAYPPDRLSAAWLNINTKAELKSHKSVAGE